MKLFKLKFTITIQELYDEYAKHKKGDSVYICHFIKHNLLPRKSIFHWLYLSLTDQAATNEFMYQLAELLNIPRTTYLHDMILNIPEFADLELHAIKPTTQHHIQFRTNVLKRILELHPNATFTFHY